MTDWIRDPATNQVKLNSEKINEIVRKLMERVKTLTIEKDKYATELNELKDIFGGYTKNLESIKCFNNQDIDDDELETDGCSPTKESPIPPLLNDVHGKKIDSNNHPKVQQKDSHSSLIDHSACCSKDLSLKLIEQNQILQKTIRDILKLSGHSIDDYLKFTYNREKFMAKEQEIKDLRVQVKKLKEQSKVMQLPNICSENEVSNQMKNLHLSPLERKQTNNSGFEPRDSNDRQTSDPMIGLSSKVPGNGNVCENCLKNFGSRRQEYEVHWRRCNVMFD